MKKLVIGIPTYEAHQYCLDKLLSALKLVMYDDVTIVFADNSGTDAYATELRKKGFLVLHEPPINGDSCAQAVQCRNIIINYFLKHDFDALLLLSSDVMPPPLTLKYLLEDEAAVAVGVYLNDQHIQGERVLAPMLRIPTVIEDHNVPVPINKVLGQSVFPISVSGFGCVLFHRKVLEKVKLVYAQGKEEFDFFGKVSKAGFSIVADCRVKCDHVKPSETFTIPDAIIDYNYSLNVAKE